jgi:hypothetical protein
MGRMLAAGYSMPDGSLPCFALLTASRQLLLFALPQISRMGAVGVDA